MFENLREDWQTYDRQISRQGLWIMVVYRFGRWRYSISSRWLRLPFSLLYKVLKPISEILTGIELPCEATLGRRFRIDHFGGIVISGDAAFGDDCVIRNGVTVGLRHTGQRGAPILGNRVDVGAGAKILGAIHIGDDVAVGANAGSLVRRALKLHRGRRAGAGAAPEKLSGRGHRGATVSSDSSAAIRSEHDGALHPSSTAPAERLTSAKLSIVIIGRNEGERLSRCLQSVRNIRGVEGQVDILYVDSASTDGSSERASALGARVLSVNAERPTAATGRNAGWQQADSEFILFLDGDTILDAGFPEAAIASMNSDVSLAAVWGHRREIHPEQSIYNRLLDLDWIYAPGLAEFCGGDVLMRRDALLKAGGYDATLIAGEEPELCRRMRALGYRILHIDHPMTGHDLQMRNFSQYWKRATRAGHAYAEVSSRFRRSGDPFWAAESRANLIRGAFWLGSFLAAFSATAFTLQLWPIALWAALLLVLSGRSAWKTRWKSRHSPLLLLAYGIHSHLQQIPICVGQLQYLLDEKRGRRRKLIEYKESGVKP